MFTYDEQAKEKRNNDVLKIAKKLMADIQTSGTVRNDKFIKTIPDFSKWLFNFTVKQLKKERKI